MVAYSVTPSLFIGDGIPDNLSGDFSMLTPSDGGELFTYAEVLRAVAYIESDISVIVSSVKQAEQILADMIGPLAASQTLWLSRFVDSHGEPIVFLDKACAE